MHAIVWFWTTGIHDPAWAQAAAAIALVALTIVTLLVLAFYAWDTHTLAKTSVSQAAHMSNQTEMLRQSVAVAKQAADAAEIQARAAMGVAVPTLVLVRFGFAGTGIANLEAKLQFPEMRVVIKNYGQTPAFLKSYGLSYSCEGIASTDEIQLPFFFDDGTVVEAGQQYVLQDAAYTRWEPFSAQDVTAILSKKKTLSIAGCLWYGDVFGSPPRSLTFCKELGDFQPDGTNLLWMDCDSAKKYGAILNG